MSRSFQFVRSTDILKFRELKVVSINVGAMVLVRIPCGARSRAMALFMPSSAHFDAQYNERLTPPTCPICDDILMIEPPAGIRRATV